MNLHAIIMMLVILGLVWGGFGFCLLIAVKKSRIKKQALRSDSEG